MEVHQIHKNIQKKLFERIRGVNRETHDSQNAPLGPVSNGNVDKAMSAVLTKACWARAISAVVDTDNESGKLFRLSSAFDSLGSGGFNPKNSPLASQDDFMTADASATFRPHSGITGISTQFKSHSVQGVTINWKLWDLNQFAKFQNAFLKHGRIVCVEFGWSVPSIFEEKPTIDTVEGLHSLYRAQREKILLLGGDYYVTTGKIVNFSYTVGQNGEYECTTELTAMANDVFTTQNPDDSSKSPVKTSPTAGMDVAIAMKRANNNFTNYIKTLDKHLASAYSHDEKECYYDGELSYCTWGYFEDVILNTYFSFTNKQGANAPAPTVDFAPSLLNYIRSRHHYDGTDTSPIEDDNFCRYHSEIATQSLNIILPGTTIKVPGDDILKKLGLADDMKFKYQKLRQRIEKIENHFASFKFKKENEDYGIIRNMVFSSAFLQQIWKDGVSTLESGLNSHWNTVSAQYAGFWDFEVRADEYDTSRIGVFDKYKSGTPKLDSTNPNEDMGIKSTDKPGKEKFDGAFEFSVYGRHSIMKGFSLNVEHSSKMATMATFHSNKPSNTDVSTPGPDELSMRALMAISNTSYAKNSPGTTEKSVDSKDELLDELKFPFQDGEYVSRETNISKYEIKKIDDTSLTFMANPVDDTKTSMEETKTLIADEKRAKEAEGKNYWFERKDDNSTDNVVYDTNGDMMDMYVKTMNGLINNTLIDPKTNKATVDPIVPVKVTFSIPGIAGLKVFDIFTIDYLPENYKKRCMFQIMKISHTIGLQGWTTGVEAIMRVDLTKVIQDNPSLQTQSDTVNITDEKGWLEQVNRGDDENKPKPVDFDEYDWWNPADWFGNHDEKKDGKIFG